MEVRSRVACHKPYLPAQWIPTINKMISSIPRGADFRSMCDLLIRSACDSRENGDFNPC
jgi:hypothetical protein